jgi:hypothetical protein
MVGMDRRIRRYYGTAAKEDWASGRRETAMGLHSRVMATTIRA